MKSEYIRGIRGTGLSRGKESVKRAGTELPASFSMFSIAGDLGAMNRKNKNYPFAGALLAIALCGASGTAMAGSFVPAANVQLGTLGYGLGLTFAVVPRTFNVRTGFNTFSFSRSKVYDGANFNGNIKFQNMPILADWYPFHGAFHLTAGGWYNNNKITLTGVPNSGSTYTINGNTYSASQVGSLTGQMKFKTFDPYVGIGWGNPMWGSAWDASFDVGALYEGAPQISITATGEAANPALASDLNQVRNTATTDTANYKWWPVIQFGVSYRF